MAPSKIKRCKSEGCRSTEKAAPKPCRKSKTLLSSNCSSSRACFSWAIVRCCFLKKSAHPIASTMTSPKSRMDDIYPPLLGRPSAQVLFEVFQNIFEARKIFWSRVYQSFVSVDHTSRLIRPAQATFSFQCGFAIGRPDSWEL